ncbi:MAG: CpsD/CapB family tyrosine-protein kinase, partial [Solirubrobacteraceae bacterium]
VQTANAQVVNTATPPSSPSSPKTKQLAAVALVLGLLVGVGFAFLLNLFDRRVKSWEEFEELYGMSALASIPLLPRRPRALGELESAIEPFRILHNSLSVLRSSHQVKTVLVTSAIPGEGKTTVALGLARAAALSGQEVILVEADLRRPTLKQQLLLHEGSVRTGQGSLELGGDSRGLTSVLLDGTNPLDLLTHSMPDLERLKFLFGGPVNLTATNLMRSGRLAKAFDLLASHVDLVVIDSAPLLPVVDTQLLLDEVAIDACLIVARVGTTTREQARRARAIFDRRQLSSTGLVINGISEIADGSYYGYGHETEETAVTQSGLAGPQNGSGSGLSRPPSYPKRFAIEHNAPASSQDGNGAASISEWSARSSVDASG